MGKIIHVVAGAMPISLRDFGEVRIFLADASSGSIERSDVFQTIDWFENLSKHGFAQGVRPLLLGIDLKTPSKRFVFPLMQTREGLASLSNYYSSLYGVMGEAPEDPQEWLGVAQFLQADPSIKVLMLHPLSDSAIWVGALGAALRSRGFWVDSFECFGNWYLPVGGVPFDGYFAARPSALRNSINRGRRRLARQQGYALEIHQYEGLKLDAAIAAFEAVYLQSWKQPEPCPRFIPGLVRVAAQRGWLRLGILSIEGQAIAAQIWLVHASKANIYKLAYIEGFERFSPGSVLTAALMQYVIDVDRVREVDYLTGDDAYKSDWMSHRRLRVGLVAFAWRRPAGWIAGICHFAGRFYHRLIG